MKKKVQLRLRVTRQLLERLKTRSHLTGRSLNSEINIMLEVMLAATNREQTEKIRAIAAEKYIANLKEVLAA